MLQTVMDKNTILLISLFFFTANNLIGQPFYEFNGRPVTGSARTASLGSAAVGEAYDVNSMYWNPATLSFLQQSSVSVSSIFGLNGQSFDNTLSLPPIYSDNYQIVATGIASSYYGEKWSQPNFSYNGADLGYSLKIHPTLSVGTLINIRYGSKSLSGLWALSGTIGGFYIPSSGISYGIVYDGIGSGVSYRYDGYAGTLQYVHNLNQSIHIGSSFRFPSLYRMPYIILSMESQKFIKTSGITYRGGIETFPSQFISLRIGIVTSSTATAGTFGLGFHINHLRFDYAYSSGRTIDRFHHVSISYQPGT